MMISSLLEEGRAQATIEMALVAPVMIVLALITYNVMVFMSAVARFDRVAPDIVLAHGVAPASGGAVMMGEVRIEDGIKGQLEQAMEGYDVAIEVDVCEGAGGEHLSNSGDEGGPSGGPLLSMAGALRTVNCVLRYEPWPRVPAIAGVESGTPFSLTHARPVVIDPWRSGVLV